MKRISGGYYYHVYDLGNGKVLKKQKNKFLIFIFILFADRLNIKKTIKDFRSVLSTASNFRDFYKNFFDICIDKNLLGNPTLLEGINYEQDKVLILKNLVKKASNEQFISILKDYIGLVKKLWGFGLHENVFNFTLNNGYNKNNELILVDFNEVTFNQKDVIKDIKEKTWLYRRSYMKLNKEHKAIFRDLMEKEITEENLKSLWNTKKIDSGL